MPKKAIDYSNCCIYKIEHIDKDDLVYVGHTTNFTKRKCCHKQRCNSETSAKHNLKLYQLIRENGGWDMFRMIEVEKYPCLDRREADKRETEVMKELKSNMNVRNSYTSKEEKIKKKKEYNENHIEDRKLRYERNKDQVKLNRKEYYEINKEITLQKRKEYCELNKEKVKKTYKKYYEANKEKINEKRRIEYQKKKEEKANKL